TIAALVVRGSISTARASAPPRSFLEIAMLARPTLTRPVQDDSSKPKGQARPIDKRFLLRVDGQVKTSLSTKEPAVTAGAAIKKGFPVVVVTVVDTEQGTTEIINP